MKNVNMRSVPQSQMTCECWTVQFQGLSACESCEFKDTDECGGVNIRKTGKNGKGFQVPLGSELTSEPRYIKITQCQTCPKLSTFERRKTGEWFSRHDCTVFGRPIPDMREIPEWCKYMTLKEVIARENER